LIPSASFLLYYAILENGKIKLSSFSNTFSQSLFVSGSEGVARKRVAKEPKTRGKICGPALSIREISISHITIREPKTKKALNKLRFLGKFNINYKRWSIVWRVVVLAVGSLSSRSLKAEY